MSKSTNCTTSEAHSCSAFCSAQGICQIDTAPLSVEATFTGRHETFQFTKVSTTRLSTSSLLIPSFLFHSIRKVCQELSTLGLSDVRVVAKRLQCIKTIEPGGTSHAGPHIHSKEKQIFHYCETRYAVFSWDILQAF